MKREVKLSADDEGTESDNNGEHDTVLSYCSGNKIYTTEGSPINKIQRRGHSYNCAFENIRGFHGQV